MDLTHIGAGDHAVRFYGNDAALINSLANYVAEGFRADDLVIVVATKGHRRGLHVELARSGFDAAEEEESGRYVHLDAEDLLTRFMVDGTPEPMLFERTLTTIIDRIPLGDRKVRIFGEMVALLWARGDASATLQLEKMWNDFSALRSFSLLCAYPLTTFDSSSAYFFRQICDEHSKLLPVSA